MPKKHSVTRTETAILLDGEPLLTASEAVSIPSSPLHVDVYSVLTDRIRSGSGFIDGDQFECEGSVFASVSGHHLVLEV